MIEDKLPQTLDEVREVIDGLGRELIELLVRRQKLARRTDRLKSRNDTQVASTPERVAQMVASHRACAERAGLSPGVIEVVWYSMIDAFIKLEMDTNRTDGAQSKSSDNGFDKRSGEEAV